MTLLFELIRKPYVCEYFSNVFHSLHGLAYTLPNGSILHWFVIRKCDEFIFCRYFFQNKRVLFTVNHSSTSSGHRGLALLWRISDRFARSSPSEDNRALNSDSRNAANTGYGFAISDWVAHQGEPIRHCVCNISTPIEMSANSAYSVCVCVCVCVYISFLDASRFNRNR